MPAHSDEMVLRPSCWVALGLVQRLVELKVTLEKSPIPIVQATMHQFTTTLDSRFGGKLRSASESSAQ